MIANETKYLAFRRGIVYEGNRQHEFPVQDQDGQDRAAYGDALIERPASDLTKRFGRGFSRQNLQQMRSFYLAWPIETIRQTLFGKSSIEKTQQAFGARRLEVFGGEA